jgi:putative molybdopterin biosynthesis protein
VPVAKERYDIAVPKEYMTMKTISSLLEIIRHDTEFRESVEKLGGYDVSDMGTVVYES